MEVVRSIAEVRAARRALKGRGRVALVPTMGALHAGHLSHVERAKRVADRVVASIFVNPTQFGPNEDFQRYPRPFELDVQQCEQAGVDLVFAPEPEDMYPPGQMDAFVTVPALARMLEGEARPDHYQGVCRVVAKLLNLVQPDVVTFGLKDYQQLRVVEAMIGDLFLPIEVVEVPTLREPDGLAMSSRNRYLDETQRPHAVGLVKALRQAKALVEQAGETDPEAVEAAMAEVIRAHGMTIDYAVVRHPKTLQPLDIIEPALTNGVVALVAARLGPVRLIDNMRIGAGDET